MCMSECRLARATTDSQSESECVKALTENRLKHWPPRPAHTPSSSTSVSISPSLSLLLSHSSSLWYRFLWPRAEKCARFAFGVAFQSVFVVVLPGACVLLLLQLLLLLFLLLLLLLLFLVVAGPIIFAYLHTYNALASKQATTRPWSSLYMYVHL